MRRTLLCGSLFDGHQQIGPATVTCDGGRIIEIRPGIASSNGQDGEIVDASRHFVMPGMIDVHTHLAYGNAKTEEDIDLYASQEFRAIRGMFFAQQVLAAGITSMCVPGGSGHVSTAVRDAIDAGLFPGPRTTASGPYITARQGLTDWYPTWIGVPDTSIGRLVRSPAEAIEEIRRQVKDGVDAVKFALDGIQRRPNGEHVAAFDEAETATMITEVKRLGRISIVHARGREATLYAAKAGADLIFHASHMDDEGLDWIMRNGCAIAPTLTFLRNTIDFLQPSAPYSIKGARYAFQREYEAACVALDKAHRAGVPMPTGTDTGFAVTPFGEWHGREAQLYVDDLGFAPIDALRACTSVAAAVLRPADHDAGRLAVDARADMVIVDADPLDRIDVLQPAHIVAVWKDGATVDIADVDYDPRRVTDFAQGMFDDLYTRRRVGELRGLTVSPGTEGATT